MWFYFIIGKKKIYHNFSENKLECNSMAYYTLTQSPVISLKEMFGSKLLLPHNNQHT